MKHFLDEPKYQALDSLEIILDGGYGMFFDDFSIHIVICETCANSLLEQFPAFRVIKEL